ncbi:MAG: LysR family transcriptional regulator substrate-binding protein [Acidobacteria bacterium]|nr:LysR family transcriptional regulator substrate-binding protein [Acidobacteriota bacterium]MBS1866169.1 LysR family transcriptional regulator substrate-binding protein [Acidobacteriota bacterium]
MQFLLHRDGYCFRENAVAACGRSRVHPQVIFENGQFSSLLGMAGSGVGLSLIPEVALDKKSGCTFVAISGSEAARTIGAVVLRRRSLTRANLRFMPLLRQPAK